MKDNKKDNSQNEVNPDLDNILKDNGEKLSKQEKKKLVVMKQEVLKGPLPHPNILKGYEEIDPGSAHKIIESGLAESKDRRDLQNRTFEAIKEESKRRDWMGYSIGVLIIAIGALLVYTGHAVYGSIFSGVSAIAMVSLFLGQSNDVPEKKGNHKKDNNSKSA